MKLNFITSGKKFPYPYYISICTALLAHKGKVVLWYVEEPDSKYFQLLKKRKDLEIKKTPLDRAFFEKLEVFKPLDEHLKVITMFDYLIWKIVSEEGGIIAGLSSINLKDWQDLLEDGKEMLIPRDSEAVPDSYTAHGVIIRKGSKLAEQIFKDICKVMEGKELTGRYKAFKDGKLVFGGVGMIPYLNVVQKNIDKVSIADVGVLGGVNVDHKKKGFYLHQNKDVGEFLNKDVRTIPLYGSSNIHFDEIDEEYIANSDSVLGELVKRLLLERVWNPFNEPVWGFSLGKELPLRFTGNKFRFHVLGLVHLPTSERYNACAFTQKNVKMCKMLLSLGHEVFLYGAEGSDAPCTKFIQTHTLKDIRDSWGEGDNRFEIGYDWHNKQFKNDFNSERKSATLKYYATASSYINSNKKSDDFLLVTQGTYQKPIKDSVNLSLSCEPGIGYRGSFANFRAFESTYIQNFTYGSEHPRQSINGHYYDRVIPNYFDEKDFPYVEKKSNYYLFIGRLIQRKGITTAIKTVRAIGGKLIVAGQKDEETKDIPLNDPICEYVGFADSKKRADLMGRAKAVFCPSTFLEPFCGVFAESNLCGTPVITTNFGAFSDYIINGLNGYRCNTLQDFVDATKAVEKLNPRIIRKYAERFTLDRIKLEYQRWFQDIYRVWESQVDTKKKAWHHLE